MSKNDLLTEAARCLSYVYLEMNEIYARDGVPYTSDGTRSNVSQEWWDQLMAECDRIVRKVTGHQAWLNPLLYDGIKIPVGEVVER